MHSQAYALVKMVTYIPETPRQICILTQCKVHYQSEYVEKTFH